MVEKRLKITGLDCVDCANRLESAVAALPQVDEVRLLFFDGVLMVRGAVDQKDLRQMISKLGYGVDDDQQSLRAPAEDPNSLLGFSRYLFQRVETRFAIIAIGVAMLALFLSWLGLPSWVVIGMWIGALVMAGWPIARSGLVNLWVNRTFNIDILMTLAAVGAVVIGEYSEAVALILLFILAEAMEGFTNARARGALSQLTDLAPTHAVKLKGGHERAVPVETLLVGDHIIVQPGERVPLDGVIIEGHSDINQAPITGESIPVWKGFGEEVFSGTVNGNGRLIVEVSRLVTDSTLHRIIQLVTDAQSRRSRSQKFIDKFARYYTPAMVMMAILIATVPPIFLGEPLLNLADGTRGWLYRALALLVISCPCALVISTPVTMVATLTKAVREGVLFKGSIFIEKLASIDAFAFDKTGTLTYGVPKVVESKDLACLGGLDCDPCNDMIALAYALERHSTHPLAEAITAEAEKRGVTDWYPSARNLVTRGGMGLEGDINGRRMAIGSRRLFDSEHDIPVIVREWVDQAESAGRTAMLLCDGEQVRGFIAVEDTPRLDSQKVIHELNQMKKQTIMLTGDNATVAGVIGAKVGLVDIRSNLLPGDKQQAITALRKQYGSVAMIGDGINDAPALASADLGIAMGGSGSAQAMETADVVLMADDIHKLPFALKLSVFANRLIKQNIIFSLGSKLIVAVIAVLGYAPLWLAVLADMGVSLLVTANGLRAIRFKN